MNSLSFMVKSLIVYGGCVILTIVLTIADSAFANTSVALQRAMTFFLLVVPAGIGTFFGVQSLRQDEDYKFLAVMGIILNLLFGLFHLAIVLFAG